MAYFSAVLRVRYDSASRASPLKRGLGGDLEPYVKRTASTSMLEPPDVQDGQIVACLQAAYGSSSTEIAFLPLGADVDTALWRTILHGTFSSSVVFMKLQKLTEGDR